MTILEFYSSPDRWCQAKEALRADGMPCTADDPLAVSWCLLAAVIRCYYGEGCKNRRLFVAERLLRTAYPSFNDRPDITQSAACDVLVGWNDDPWRTFADVQDVVRRAGV